MTVQQGRKLIAAIVATIAVVAAVMEILDSQSAKEIGAYLWPGWVVGILAGVGAVEAALLLRGGSQASAIGSGDSSPVAAELEPGDGEVTGFPSDFAAVQAMLSYVDEHPPKAVDFLEYSSMAVTSVLAKLGEVGTTARIRLLVCHPDHAITPYQRDHRLAEGLRALAYHITADHARDIGLQIKCYSERASLRGRLLDEDVVVAGWYTYDHRERAQPPEEEISGGSNALVWADPGHTVGECVAATFTRTFGNLWDRAEPADDAWAPYMGRLSNLPSAEWFQAVRPRDLQRKT